MKCCITFVILCGLIIVGCNRLKPNDIQVDERKGVRSTFDGFIQIAGSLTVEQRSDMQCIEQLYRAAYVDDPEYRQMRGPAWCVFDYVSRKQYSYLVYPRRNAEPPVQEAIFIAAPLALTGESGRETRLVVTHALKIVELDESSFHQTVIKQLTGAGR